MFVWGNAKPHIKISFSVQEIITSYSKRSNKCQYLLQQMPCVKQKVEVISSALFKHAKIAAVHLVKSRLTNSKFQIFTFKCICADIINCPFYRALTECWQFCHQYNHNVWTIYGVFPQSQEKTYWLKQTINFRRHKTFTFIRMCPIILFMVSLPSQFAYLFSQRHRLKKQVFLLDSVTKCKQSFWTQRWGDVGKYLSQGYQCSPLMLICEHFPFPDPQGSIELGRSFTSLAVDKCSIYF